MNNVHNHIITPNQNPALAISPGRYVRITDWGNFNLHCFIRYIRRAIKTRTIRMYYDQHVCAGVKHNFQFPERKIIMKKPILLFSVEHLHDFDLCILIPIINGKLSRNCEYMMYPEEVQGFIKLYNDNPVACEFAYRKQEEMLS